MTRIAIITNEPPPYRIPIFNRIAKTPGVTLQVIFCARREPNRNWDLPAFECDHRFLKERITTIRGRYIHTNPDVIPALDEFKPDVIVCDGLNPTHIISFFYSWYKRIPFIPLTDGTDDSERGLSRIHKMIRKMVYSRSRAFLSASDGGQRLFESYGADPDKCYRSYLCTDNDAYFSTPEPAEKTYDLIFCSRMVVEKGPMFALDVASRMAALLKRKIHILFAGSGPEDAAVRAAAAERADSVVAHFHGFAKQAELPGLYRSAKVFLFPTSADVWGVVANEACAAALPVIVTPHAGVANELVVNGRNGFVCELDVELWATHAAELVSNPELWSKFSAQSQLIVQKYSFDNAANGVLDACHHALRHEPSKRKQASKASY